MRSASSMVLLLLLLAVTAQSAASAKRLCPQALVLNSYNFPTRYVTRDGKGSLLLREGNGTRFVQHSALDGSSDGISFEALSAPGYFAYNYDNVIHLKKNDNSASFKKEATFKLMKGREGFVRLQGSLHPNHYVRHQSFKLKLHKWSETALFKKDSLFGIVCTSNKEFRLDICQDEFSLISLNYPKRKVLAKANVTTTLSASGMSKFKFRSPALNGNPRAVSVESVEKPGYYLTTLEDHFVVLQKFNGKNSFKEASSFKLIVMQSGFVRLQSVSNPRHYIRHSEYKLRLDRWADTKLYKLDSSWKIHCYVVPCKSKHFVYNPTYEHAHGPECEFAPSNWHRINPWCQDTAANRPSPIKIELSKCSGKSAVLKPIKLGPGWHQEREFKVRNNGHSLQADAVNSADLTVKGGNLKGKFNCFQFHFHWGSAANMEKGVGSEHQLFDASGKRQPTPMEVHIVCKRLAMNVTAAVNTPDAIAVLGGFIHPFDSAVHDGWAGHVVAQVLLNIAQLRTPGSKSSSFEKVELQLRDLLPESLHRFVNYDGAFTTPNCNPVAQWHIFTEPMKIRKKLMLRFTKTFFDAAKKRPMVDNFRPLMSLHGREIRCSYANGEVGKREMAKATEGGAKALS